MGQDADDSLSTNDGITFPITDTLALLNDVRTLVDAPLVLLFFSCTLAFVATMTSTILRLAAQIFLEVRTFVVDVLVDGLVTDNGVSMELS